MNDTEEAYFVSDEIMHNAVKRYYCGSELVDARQTLNTLILDDIQRGACKLGNITPINDEGKGNYFFVVFDAWTKKIMLWRSVMVDQLSNVVGIAFVEHKQTEKLTTELNNIVKGKSNMFVQRLYLDDDKKLTYCETEYVSCAEDIDELLSTYKAVECKYYGIKDTYTEISNVLFYELRHNITMM